MICLLAISLYKFLGMKLCVCIGPANLKIILLAMSLYEQMETQTTKQRQCNHGRWPEAHTGQQYR